jgi:hypothetical protein
MRKEARESAGGLHNGKLPADCSIHHGRIWSIARRFSREQGVGVLGAVGEDGIGGIHTQGFYSV